jgi:hypothetical protein
MSEEGPYRTGQVVRVSYDARVAEVSAGVADAGGRLVRLEPVEAAAATGWVDPTAPGITIDVIAEAPPLDPGVYWQNDDPSVQSNMSHWHTDGKAFFYRNASGYWADMGWGTEPDQREPLNRLVDMPF